MTAVRPTGFPALADITGHDGSPSALLMVGLVLLAVLLLRALINNARFTGRLAVAALGCFARTIGTIVFGAVVLVLLVIAMASSTTGSSADTPSPTTPATTPAGPRAGG